jgi:hypothetical protein
VDPVCGHDDVRASRDVGEHCDRPLASALYPLETVPQVESFAAQSLHERVEQHLLKPPAVRRELGIGIPGCGAPRLTPDLLAAVRAVEKEFGCHRSCPELVKEAQGAELPDGVRQKVDADAKGTQLVDGLVDLDVDTDLMEAERRRQPADPSAHDEDPQPV